MQVKRIVTRGNQSFTYSEWMGMSVEERFDVSHYICGDTGCWMWIGDKGGRGYGRIAVNHKRVPAHRYSYEQLNGTIPEGLQACHYCDVKLCVNPSHVFLGTLQDNMDDMKSKSRQALGERNCSAKLVSSDIRKIRSDNRMYKYIAPEFGVSVSNICCIKKRQTWRHVDD